jgi:hypothetical protein
LGAIGAAVSAFLLPAAAAQAQPPMDAVHFRDAVAARINKTDPNLKATARSELELRYEGGGWIDLTNGYARYRSDPSSFDAIVGQYLRVVAASGHEVEIDKQKLLLMVRPVSFIDASRRHYAEAGRKYDDKDLPLHRPLAGELVAIIAQDEPQGYAYPPLGDLQKAFGGDQEAAWSAAAANSRARVGEVTVQNLDMKAIAIVPSDPAVGASLLLDDEVWTRPEVTRIGPRPVAFVGKTFLIVADGTDAEAIAHLRDFVVRQVGNPEWVSAELYVRNGGGWSVLPH